MNLNGPACIPDGGEPRVSDGVHRTGALAYHRAGLTYQEPSMTDKDTIARLIADHDARTLGLAFAGRLLADGKHEAAEVVRAMLGEVEGIINPEGIQNAAITGTPPNPGG